MTGYEIERCQGAGCSSFGVIATVTTTSFSNTALTSATAYTYRVRATDAAGNKGPYSPQASASTPDTIAPSAPTTLTATATSSSQINLSWPASTDNVAVTNYLIERCQGAGCSSFAQVATSATTNYSNAGLAAGTSYSFRVRATDAASNLGSYSPTATAATQSGGTPLTPAFVQRNYLAPGSAARTTVTVPYAAAQTAGNLNVVVIAWNDGTTNVQAVTDTRGHVYRLAVGPTRVSATASLAIYYAANITASAANANSVTVTFNAATVYPDVRIAEYSGISATDPLDVAIGATGTGTTANSGSVTTTNANDLLVGGNYIATYTNAAGSGYTSRVITSDGNLLEDRNVTAVGSYNATSTQGSGWWIMQMAAFKAGLSRWHGRFTSADRPRDTDGHSGVNDPDQFGLGGSHGQRGRDELPDRALPGGGLLELRADRDGNCHDLQQYGSCGRDKLQLPCTRRRCRVESRRLLADRNDLHECPGHDAAGRAGIADRDADLDDADQSELAGGDRQRGRHRLPDRTLPGRGLLQLRSDRDRHGDDLQQHRAHGDDELQLSGTRDGCGDERRRVFTDSNDEHALARPGYAGADSTGLAHGDTHLDDSDQSQLGRRDRQRRGDELPDRTLPGRGLLELRASRDERDDGLQQHGPHARHELQLQGPGNGCRYQHRVATRRWRPPARSRPALR